MSKRYYLCNLIPLGTIDLAHLEVDWTKEDARDGEVVEMRVVVKIPLDIEQPNVSIQFEINESDYLLFGGWDDHVVTISSELGEDVEHRPFMVLGETDAVPIEQRFKRIFVSPMPARDSQPWTLIRAYWLAEWRDDVAGEPEYYFDFKLIDFASVEHRERSDRELTVSAESVIMHSRTFPETTREPERQGVEFEAAMTLSFNETPAFNGRWLYDTLHEDDWNLFRRLRRCRGCEAYTAGYDIDEMPWDEERHSIREKNPFVWLTIEDDRFQWRGGLADIDRRRRLAFGTDLFDDIYFDTPDFICMDNDISIRARKRWDGWRVDQRVTLDRMSIGVKFTRFIDPQTGLKHDEKIDDRLGGTPTLAMLEDFLGSIITDVQGGFTNWTREGTRQARQPVPSLRVAYQTLAALDLLPTIGRYERVLALEPQVFLRQIRSRYHFNEARIQNIRNLHQEAGKRLQTIMGLLDRTIPEVGEFAIKANAILNRTLVAQRAREALKKLNPEMNVTVQSIAALLPDSDTTPSNLNTLQKMEVIARTISDLYHELATNLASIQSLVIGPPDDTVDAARFRHWQRSIAHPASALRAHTTFDRFADIHRGLLEENATELRAHLEAYNRFGEEERQADVPMFSGFKPLDEGSFRDIADQLLLENLRIWKRQIEAAGSAALGLWFDKAREFYVRRSERTRQIGNFVIDTIDLTGMFGLDAWGNISVADWDNQSEPDIDNLFHATLVNEVQIELGLENPYMDRIASLLFMLWVEEKKPELAPNKDTDDFRRLFDRLNDQRAEALQKTIDEINDFIFDENFTIELSNFVKFEGIEPENQSLRPLTVRTFKEIDRESISVIIRDPTASMVKNLKINLAGAVFVFGQYRQMLTEITRLKRDRVLQVLREANGPPDMEWVNSELSKGATALTRLRKSASTSE